MVKIIALFFFPSNIYLETHSFLWRKKSFHWKDKITNILIPFVIKISVCFPCHSGSSLKKENNILIKELSNAFLLIK